MYKINFLLMTTILSLNMSAYAMQENFMDEPGGDNFKILPYTRNLEEKNNEILVEELKNLTQKIENFEVRLEKLEDNKDTKTIASVIQELILRLAGAEQHIENQKEHIYTLNKKLDEQEGTISMLTRRLSNLEEKMFPLESSQYLHNRYDEEEEQRTDSDDEEGVRQRNSDSE